MFEQGRGSADVISVTQSIVPGCENFRDAVRFLAGVANLSEPQERRQ
jgi:hypothetical protein